MKPALNLIQQAGAGTAASAWQTSPSLAAVPTIELHELLPRGSRLAVVAPHPDDEVLGCGGLLATLTRCDVAVDLIAVTDGEASHPGSAHWPVERLREARIRESQLALSRLGLARAAGRWTRLRCADSQVAEAEDRLAERLTALLASYTHVISTWQLDGHGDHEAVGRATALAAAASLTRHYEMPIWAWHWAAPDDPRLPWQRARKLALDQDALARKQAAIAAHRSQLLADPSTGAAPILGAATLARFAQPYEVFFL